MGSLEDWLNGIKAGYGSKYGSFFEDLGVDDMDDLPDIASNSKTMAKLEANLYEAGAKEVHVIKIQKALATLTNTAAPTKPQPPDDPPPSSRSPRKPSLLENAPDPKRFAAFLSHFKKECGTEARLVQQNLKPLLESGHDQIFLDSDDLQDLRLLLEHVKDSQAIVLLQSKSVLTRPWVILELYTAVTHGVPIVALNVQNSYAYNYGEALAFLTHFDKEIEIANPGAAQLLLSFDVDPQYAT